MGTTVEFRLLILDSLKCSSKAESPINRSAKAVISRNLTTSRHNHLFIYLFYFYFILFIFLSIFNFLFHFSSIYRKQTLTSYLHSDSNRCYWLTWMNRKYLFITEEIKFSNSCLLWQTLLRSAWVQRKAYYIGREF